MSEKSYRTAEEFNWQYDAQKRIGCQTIPLHELTPSFFTSLKEKLQEEIGTPGGMDGYLLQVEVEEEELPLAREQASQNPSPHFLIQLISREGEEYWGQQGEKLHIQNPADYIVGQNIYFNRPANPHLNQPQPPGHPSLQEAISFLIHPYSTRPGPFLEQALGEYCIQEKVDVEAMLPLYPALAWMIRRLKDQQSGLHLLSFIESFLFIPYGLPIHTTYLFFALSIHYFQETLWCKVDPTTLGESPITQLDFFYALMKGEYPRARIYLRPLSSEEERVSSLIQEVFSPREEGNLTCSYRALTGWYRQLPSISRRARIHQGEAIPFVQRMEHLSFFGYSLFLKQELPEIFPDIPSGLSWVKEELEKTPERISQELKNALNEIFPQPIQEWYENLSENQRQLEGPWQNHATRSLLQALQEGGGREEDIFTALLHSSGFGPVADWEQDYRERFLTYIQEAVQLIQHHRAPIPPPQISASGTEIEEDTISFAGHYAITITPPLQGTQVMLTENGGDPRRDSPDRRVISGAYQYRGQQEKTLRLVTHRNGYYGEPVTLTLKNQLKEYAITLEENLFTGVGVMEPRASFRFPGTQEGIKYTLASLFRTFTERGLSREELEDMVLEQLESLGKE